LIGTISVIIILNQQKTFGVGIICQSKQRKISSAQSTKPDQFGDTNILYLNSKPCQFLKDKKCSIYKLRPEECNSYPYLHKDNFISRLLGVIENYEICPIVYNVYELLEVPLN
jgi:Fe-S-cluster containining protein